MKPFPLLLILILIGSLGACTKQGWYEGFQNSARKECAKDREPCPRAPSYEQYKQERDKLEK